MSYTNGSRTRPGFSDSQHSDVKTTHSVARRRQGSVRGCEPLPASDEHQEQELAEDHPAPELRGEAPRPRAGGVPQTQSGTLSHGGQRVAGFAGTC